MDLKSALTSAQHPIACSCSHHSQSGTARTWLTSPFWSRSKESAPPITSQPPVHGWSTAVIWTTSPTTCSSAPPTLRTTKWTRSRTWCLANGAAFQMSLASTRLREFVGLPSETRTTVKAHLASTPLSSHVTWEDMQLLWNLSLASTRPTWRNKEFCHWPSLMPLITIRWVEKNSRARVICW